MSMNEKLTQWNDTYKEYPLNLCLHELIEEQVRRTPGNPAIRFREEQISFSELNHRANICARFLRGLGVGPESIVGVMMERSIEMTTALVGILKAGGAYLPLDPANPEERLSFMLEDAGVSVVFTQEKFLARTTRFKGTMFCLDSEWEYIAGESGDDIENYSTPDDLAYVIYTSGSTGKPKGCMLPHKAICNRLLWMQEAYVLTANDRVLQKTPYTFDVSVWEFFWPLMSGACLVMADPGGHKDTNYLVEIIRRERITTCHFVPSMLRYFIGNPNAGKCNTLRQVFTSGEALPFDLMMGFKELVPSKLHNLYGPTEAAVDVTYWECGERVDKKVPIGRPISNIRIHILDSELKQTPIGLEGELHIGGIGLARGYLNRPELTAEKFIKDPFSAEPGSRLYKTGDRAKFLPDGNVEFLGRIDFQVKLRGNRIELGEIEAVLRGNETINEAVVLVKDEESGDPKLVAYIVSEGEPSTSKQIREYVKGKLPEYMVPNYIAHLESIPVTQHGKFDRAALPWPIKERPGDTRGQTLKPKPVDSEIIVAALIEFMEKIMDITGLKGDDDLFDLGASSLTMVQMVEHIQRRYNVAVPVDVFLEEPSVKSIAEYLAKNMESLPASSAEVKTICKRDKSSDSEKVIELQHADFKESARTRGAIVRKFTGGRIRFDLFSQFLALLKQEMVNGEPKYLYPSAGGLNADQTYLFIKENAVEGVPKGVYYYHPEKHSLYNINNHAAIDRSIFFEDDRPIFDNAGFVLFFIAQMDAITPVYQSVSPTLVTLDAGYMGQLLLSRQADFNMGLCPVGGVDFDRISASFRLDESHRFIHCMLGGLQDGNLHGMEENGVARYMGAKGGKLYDHLRDFSKERTFAAFLSAGSFVKLDKMNFLTKEEHDLFHLKHMNIRKFSGNEAVIPLSGGNFPESDYLLRSCIRDYRNKPVGFGQFGRFLSLLRRDTQDKKRCLYPSVSGAHEVQAYLYIKENGVEGLSEGIYYYHPEKHALVLVTAQLSQRIKPCHTPFNRTHYQKSMFSLFLIGPSDAIYPNDERLYFAFLEAGHIGQLLMDRQAEFEMGVCPIGGVIFDKIRGDFKLNEGQVLLHSFTCGSFEREMPSYREYLEVGRGEAETKVGRLERVSLKKSSPVQRDIAIIGMAGRYPGANRPDEYWANLKEGRVAIGELPQERKQLWGALWSLPEGRQEASFRGGYLSDIDCFDNLLFNMSPAQSRSTDPQERLLMETVWECLENAGQTAEHLKRSSETIGVFVGVMWNEYQNQGASPDDSPEARPSALHSSIANRISYFFDFKGPSIALNTSCSSAMTAMHFACESIKRGECNAALVCGVNLITHPYHQNLLAGFDLLSKAGECRPLGAHTSGWLPGEGVGAFLIRPVEEAEKDNDHIHGIIKGTSVSHSGRTVRFGAPNSAMQSESIQKAIATAGLSVEAIGYVEMGVAGASIADASEVNALCKVFRDHPQVSSPCLIGSVKANIGHPESASALSQITKVLLQMKHRQIAPTVNFEPVNPLIQLQGSGLEIADRPTEWRGRNGSPRTALINAFGATGSGGHLLLQEYVKNESEMRRESKPTLAQLSAATSEQLRLQASRLFEFLNNEENASYDISDIGYTLRVGRVEMDERLAIVADSIERLREKLTMFLQGADQVAGLFRGTAVSEEELEANEESDDLLYVAKRWAQGARIVWKSLKGLRGRKVPLPTYPFAKERHWVKTGSGEVAPQKETASCSEVPAAIHDSLLEKIEEYLKTVFSKVSEISSTQIKSKAPLERYGISSLMIYALNAYLEKDFPGLPKTLFFEYQTLHDVAQYISKSHRERALALFASALPSISSSCELKSPVQPVKLERVAISNNCNKDNGVEIAIVGLGGKYPQAETISDFWENLKNGVDCITEIPKERWDYRKYRTTDEKKAGKFSKWGGFINNVDKFDPLFFNISPREAEVMDPQERLFLESVWQTIEDAGYNRDSLKCTLDGSVGVFVGVMYGEYQLLNNFNKTSSEQLLGFSSYGSIANRVSYVFDFHGPSMAVDTLCSSSLVALNLAVESIKRGECAAAIAGGVNLSLHPHKYLVHSQYSMPSSDGRCRSFGEGGDGFVSGEGVGAVLLKPLHKAVQDGDHIYGVIKGISVNHDGKTNGYTVPNPNAQAAVIGKAYKEVGIDPRGISYIEAHGTGTSLGDPIEIAALNRVFQEYTDEKQFCAIGSVKSNIGHCESAAGIAGLSKVLLQMKHRQLAPSLHSQRLNPNIDFSNTPFVVQQELAEWKRPIIDENVVPRRAGISSFGAGGSNAHLVVEEYIPGNREQADITITSQKPAVIVLSAKNESRLREQAQRLLAAVEEGRFEESDLADIAYTLQVGREAMEERVAILAGDMGELREKLKAVCEGRNGIENVYRGQVKNNREIIALFAADDELQEAFEKWIRRGNYAKTVDLWSKGFNFDWNRLYGDTKPCRISLPTYPFAGERYWIPEAEEGKAEDNVRKLDIDLCVAEPSADIGILMLQPCWKEQAIASETPAPVYAQHMVILCEPSARVTSQSIESRLAGVCCLTLQSEPASIEERFEYYAGQLFNEIRSILNDKPKGQTLIQLVVPSKGEQQLFAGLSGLLKTAHLENPKLIGQLIEVDSAEYPESIIEKLKENSRTPMASRVRYLDGKRWVGGLSEIEGRREEAGRPWKDNGIYLITGGAGELGLIFAGEIARKVKNATLILTGRSQLGNEKQTQLKQLETLGARIEYRQVDVGRKEEVADLIQSIREDFGTLHGVIHGAGLIQDSFIIKKTKEELQEVLTPKVSGLVNLDQASKDMNLDFFILFSSISGSFGNPGQADYSTANAFMDSYAGYRNALVASNRRHGRTLSINWPLWKEGGMHVDMETEKMIMQNMGMIAMQTSTGIRAFYQGLASGLDQVMVLEGNLARMKKIFLPETAPAAQQFDKASAAPISITEIDTGGLVGKVQAALMQNVSALIKVGIDNIDAETELNEYGFDSITLTKFANTLNKEYRLELTPTIFFEHSTLRAIAEYLVKEHKEVFVAKNAPQNKIEQIIPQRHRSRFAGTLAAVAAPEPVAIIGVSCKFPMADDPDEFWRNISEGKDCISEIPSSRWDWREHYGDPLVDANKTNIKWGGFINGVDKFDPLFFGISPREAELMDPQQRLLMISAWNAVEDAGYSAQSLSGTNTAIFVGMAASGYSELLSRANVKIEGHSSTGIVPSVGPNRMSYFLNIHGPSEPIETACSSSLVALHRAISVIQDSSCDMAIAGGINLLLSPEFHISLNKAGMLSIDGRCKAFSDQANGFSRGEGVGMVFLKRLKDAERDGDHIYGVIRGSAVNHGGRANSLTAPNPKAQAELLKSAYTKAGIDPRTVSYIEAHGTGTELGDPIEINGLKAAFKDMYQATGDTHVAEAHCGLGSVKSIIGHLELAAGIAGVIKVLLQLKHKTLVKGLHCDNVNPYIQLKESPFYIVRETQEWKPLHDAMGKEIPRRSGVSSFGFGGSNAHVVIEEYIPKSKERAHVAVSAHNPVFIVLSAKNEVRLKEQAQQLLTEIQKGKSSDFCLIDMAYTLQVGRDAMEERLALTAASLDELGEKLRAFVEGRTGIEDLFRGQVRRNKESLAVFAEDEDMEKTIDAWIAKGKYLKLLNVWAKGLNFDWNKLYGDSKPCRISLPTYPFAEESYWPPNPTTKSVDESFSRDELAMVQTLSSAHPEELVTVKRLEGDSKDYVLRLIKRILGLQPDSIIEPDMQLSEYGMDSITGIQLQKVIDRETGFTLDGRQFFSEFTAQEIIRQLQASGVRGLSSMDGRLRLPTVWEVDKNTSANLSFNTAGSSFEHTSSPRNVLLTGVTGFVGAFLCKEILEQGSANVYCLVRAESVPDGLERIRTKLVSYDLWHESYRQRVIPVVGDVAQPFLGMNQIKYNDLSRKIETIYHCAVYSNHVLNYQSLKKDNVNGTLSIIEFAALDRIKPIHFISSVAVCFQADGNTQLPTHKSEVALDDGRYLINGYAQTKWVSEHCLLQAHEQGIPVTIFRSSEITGSSRTGKGITEDMFHRFLRVFSEIDVAPEWEDAVIDICPVDYVCKSILTVSRQPDCYGKIYHVIHPQPIPLREFFEFLQKNRPGMRTVSFMEWASLCSQYIENMPEGSNKTILSPFFRKMDNGYRPFEGYFYNMGLTFNNLNNALASTDVRFPLIDEKWWKLCLEHIGQFNGFAETLTEANRVTPCPIREASSCT